LHTQQIQKRRQDAIATKFSIASSVRERNDPAKFVRRARHAVPLLKISQRIALAV
jgi:hypothetical protein